MNEYIVSHTDPTEEPIEIQESETAKAGSALTLLGRIKPEYGEILDQDFLNLLENFACPQSPDSIDIRSSWPDLSMNSVGQLETPVKGQLWYNSTRELPYSWDGTRWNPLGLRENLAANWGQLYHGAQIPKPVSPLTGQEFDYSDCIWSVSPASFVGKPGYMSCTTDDQAVVDMKYRLSGTDTMISGIANYLIIGVKGNYNTGTTIPPIQITPSTTPTPTPTPTSSLTPSITASITASVTPSPTLSLTPTPTPEPSNSQTPAVSQTAFPTPTPTQTPSNTPPNRPYYQMTNERCTYHPNWEVIYGCPEEPSNYNCQTVADIGNRQTTTSDCYSGNGVNRCVRQWECRL